MEKLLGPVVKTTASFIGMAVGAKTKNFEIGPTTASFLKSISGGRIPTLTDQQSGIGLRLRVM